jgi:hypothetical protein
MNIADAFFEKFDLLPIEYKRQLDNGVSAPTLEDVDAMWELLQEEQSLRAEEARTRAVPQAT